jgi:penicillin G amidase
MATVTTPVSVSRRRITLGRTISRVLVVLLPALFGLLAWLYSIARSALPQLDGKIIVPGLSSPVKVIRDTHGIPTIDAGNLDDLFFAQGYVTAQDRLWQMDLLRRYAAGELSEILGKAILTSDREQRTLSLRSAAKKSVEIASQQDRSFFEGYARGVNAYIESRRGRLPIEFRILRYSPRPWTMEDSLLIAAQMVKDLNHYPYKNALVREKIMAKLGPELTADLYVNSSWHDHPPAAARPTMDQEKDEKGVDDNEEIDEGTGSSLTRQFDDVPLERQFSEDVSALGSNNWVISGAHTESGRPLLSNDMHLGHQMPNLWYEAHLRSGNLDAVGFTLPGVPYVIVGHNQRIAWGFTNLGPAVEDVYVETFNTAGQYLTPQGWKEPERRRETIHVKGAADVNLDVVTTRHGPIITELVPGESRNIALRWTLYKGLRISFSEVDTAQNWTEFRRAFSKFDAPAQNVVYADVDGNIGYQGTGKIPIRASGDGSLPLNGSDDAHEWISYIPYEELPSIYNPPSGIIATANGRVTPDGFPYFVTNDWEAPWRTARIYRVLGSGKKFSASDMLALQTDVVSEFDRYAAERLVYSVDHASHASARAKQAADVLRAWDGRMNADSAAPLITVRSRRELMRLLLEPKLGAAPEGAPEKMVFSWKSYAWGLQSVWLENILLHQPKRWLPNGYSNYDDLLAAAVDSALGSKDLPAELSRWKWGDYNAVAIQHPILAEIPLLRHWTGPGVQPQSGSSYTVRAVSRTHGPSERMTVNLSDLDQSTFNLVTGEAGNFLSLYYMDQWKAWYEGSTFKLAYSKDAVERSRVHELIMEPRK